MPQKPVLNIAWIGPPKFNEGGQDVVGIETITANWEKYSESEPNKIIFWCLKEYVDTYKQYFTQQNIGAEVLSVEDYLEKAAKNEYDAEAAKILNIYNETISNKKRNQIIDRVYFKDLCFFYILAKDGGYVLDANVQANQHEKVNFPEYPTRMYPILISHKNAPDVWMQFSPQNNSEAREALHNALEYYKTGQQIFTATGYSEKYHKHVGNAAVNAMTLNKLPIAPDRGWKCSLTNNNAPVEEIKVIKEYVNSHIFKAGLHGYKAIHTHALLGQADRLEFDLAHGANPNLIVHPRMDVELGLNYQANDETPLNIAIRSIKDCDKDNYPAYINNIKLLLAYGADVNASYTLQNYDQENDELLPVTMYTPLLHALELKDNNVLNILCQDKNLNVGQIVENESPLIAAILHEFGYQQLLNLGADPNQTWDNQTITPLAMAILENNIQAAEILLKNGANPNTLVGPINLGNSKVNAASPIYIALANNDPAYTRLLLQYGATLPGTAQYQLQENTINIDTSMISINNACQTVIQEHMNKELISPDNKDKYNLFQSKSSIASIKKDLLNQCNDLYENQLLDKFEKTIKVKYESVTALLNAVANVLPQASASLHLKQIAAEYNIEMLSDPATNTVLFVDNPPLHKTQINFR